MSIPTMVPPKRMLWVVVGGFWTFVWALVAPTPAWTQSNGEVPARERVLLEETYRLAEQVQDSVWAGWSQAPFPILLVTSSREYLIRHPRPSSDFSTLGYDRALGDTVYARPPQFSPSLRATFPAVGGIPTIVIGPPDSTETPTRWVLTALHEHFHQWQMARPGYFAAVDSLGLAGGDDSGQWMLDYPFPYDSTAVQDRFRTMTQHLREALDAVGTAREADAVERYLEARRQFQRVLADDDYRYFSFQIWQEGVARYVEYKVAEYASAHYEVSGAFDRLEQRGSFTTAASSLRRRILDRLTGAALTDDRRVAFYAVGAAEALFLDHVNPEWRHRYWADKFALGRYYDVARNLRR